MVIKTKITNFVEEKKEEDIETKRNRRSNFFVTINTNKPFNRHSEEYEIFNGKFQSSLNEIYNDLGSYINVLDDKAKWDDNFIKDVEIDSATELGPVNHKLHAHFQINVLHNTKIQLDYNKIKEKIMKDLELKGLYIKNKIYHDNKLSLKDYISKNYQTN